MIRIVLFALSLLVLAPGARAEEFIFADVYDVTGTSPDGSAYEGTLTVEIVSDTTYDVQWKIGTTVLSGFGMRMNDMLSAVYLFEDGTPGLVMYEAADDGVLEGIWTARGRPGLGTRS